MFEVQIRVKLVVRVAVEQLLDGGRRSQLPTGVRLSVFKFETADLRHGL